MHELRRISLVNWYAFSVEDVDLRGTTAVVGPNGVGKSSLLDAVQLVMTGFGRGLVLNPASVAKKRERTVQQYCLGKINDVAEPLRPDGCESLIALVFAEPDGSNPVTCGVAMRAVPDSNDVQRDRWIAPGLVFSAKDAVVEADDGGLEFPAWDELREDLRARCPSFREYAKAEPFVNDVLASMRRGPQPNGEHFRRIFTNALAFRPIDDTTSFVRDYILEADPLRIDTVRASIRTYRGFVRSIEECKAKAEQLRRIAAQFNAWASQYVGHANAAWIAEKAERMRLDFDVQVREEALAEAEAEVEKLERFRRRRESEIAELKEELMRKRAVLAEDGVQAAIDGLQAQLREAEAAEAALAGRVASLRRLAGEADSLQRLAPYCATEEQRAALAGLGQLRHLLVESDPERLLSRNAEAIDEAIRRLPSLEGLSAHWTTIAEQIAERARPKREQARQLRDQARLLSAGGAALIRPVEAFRRLLWENQVESTALPDVVDLADPDWAFALEALLGNARYALIVPPVKLRRAFDLLYRHRNEEGFTAVTLVKTDRVRDQRRPLPAGSIAEIVRTDDEDARAFIEARVGGYVRAEDEEALRRLSRGVMRNGKSTSGLGLSVHRDRHFHPVLGKTNLASRAERMLEDARQLDAEADEVAGDYEFLREGAVKLRGLVSQAGDMDGSAARMDDELRALRLRQKQIRESIALKSAERDQELLEEVERLKEEIPAFEKELREEVGPDLTRAVDARAQRRSELEQARAKIEETEARLEEIAQRYFTSEYDALVELSGRGETHQTLAHALETRVAFDWKGNERARLAEYRNERRPTNPRADAEIAARRSGAVQRVTDYCHEWDVEHPDREKADAVRLWRWVKGQLDRIERNELLRYEEEARRAQRELEASFKEDLLTRLAEKLKLVRQQVDQLNHQLKGRRFAGSTYSFKTSVDARFSNIYKLAKAVHENPEESLDALTADPVNGAALAAAKDELTAEIERADGGEGDLADYRKYFTFDLLIDSEAGHRTSLSDRIGSDSGGQGQMAFYVAIAASLALAYYPGSRGLAPSGAGLALFDEAFNRVDPQNTKQLFSLFREMSLQLCVAVPESNRPTFVEVCDTVITVNRSPDYRRLYLHTVHPQDRLRAALAEENPGNYDARAYAERFAPEVAAGAAPVDGRRSGEAAE